ncbi:MAG TPA: histidine--tRNA ligase [Cyclobacteriaceae bacterium]|jgi:histidyl-tRNA synthetase|nr:histidine--tRNA ligase [Cyclobacteriaceae bacterium]
MNKPTIPGGTRDFSPEEVYKRQYIFNTIRSVFEKYGYQPIETPTMENLSTLEGKYGEEGDRLLFRILDSGDFYSPIHTKEFESEIRKIDSSIDELETNRSTIVNESNLTGETLNSNVKLAGLQLQIDMNKARRVILVTKEISKKGLRYDLTVPFARYVVMHQNEITFPFKRYQIQSVFRADRPQRGRYREFFQCDADVVGSDSLINEMELVKIYDEVFVKLGIDVTIKINNRKVLSGMAESIHAIDKFMDITIAIDKLDKIGLQGVRQELTNKGLSESQLQVIEKFFSIEGMAKEKLVAAKELLKNSETGLKGIAELEKIFEYLEISGVPSSSVEVDFTLARGLNYYTGAIIEVKPNNIKMGSIGGGGRYDDLTGVFGLKGVSGVGISFGADRIYDVMEELKLFPESTQAGTKVLFAHFDEAALNYSLPLVQKVRAEGIGAEIYPSSEKIKKQMKYADDKKIAFVILVGENEMQTGKLTMKNMLSGEQESLTIDEAIFKLK